MSLMDQGTRNARAPKRQAKDNTPDFIARTKADPTDPRNTLYITLGAAWKVQLRDGSEGIGIKLSAKPWNGWNGDILLVPPFARDDAGPIDD